MLIEILEEDVTNRELIGPLEHGTLELVDDFLFTLRGGNQIKVVFLPGNRKRHVGQPQDS